MIHLPAPRLCSCGVVHRNAPPRASELRPYFAFFASNTLKNLMLDVLQESLSTGADFGSLHTAYSTTGASEVTGGSPAYGRSALTWNAAGSGAIALGGTLPTWNVPTGTTVAWVGLWDANTSGNFLGMFPAGAQTLQACSMQASGDITANTINAKAHGFSVDHRVVFWPASGVSLPSPLANGTIYYVGTVPNADSFTVSTTAANGNPVDITGTAPFNFFVQRCVPETFGAQGTYSLTSASVDLTALL